MRVRLSELSFWGVLVALGLSAAAAGCVLTPLDPDEAETIGEVQSDLNEEVETPEADETGGPADPSEDEEPNPVPWKDKSDDAPLGGDRLEPNPVPWQPPSSCEPTTTTSTRKAIFHDH